MKRGKEEEKAVGPMFPRLHVNDTAEKGGPRAPPRNKMALYEQLSIPSQRFGSALNPTLPSPASSSQVSGGYDRNLFPRQSSASTTSPWSDKSHARHLDGTNGTASIAPFERRKRERDEDDFTVPVFVQARVGKSQATIQNNTDRETVSSISPPPSGQPVEWRNMLHVGPKNNNLTHTNLGREAGNEINGNKKSGGHHGVRTVISSTNQSTRENADERVMEAKTSSAQQYFGRSSDGEACLHPKSRKDENLIESTRDKPTIEPHCVEDNSNSNRACISLLLESVDKGDDVSEISMMDSKTGLDLTPDEVVGIIGQKHFWKARKAIVDQQRVFAVQVFELHRLIKEVKTLKISGVNDHSTKDSLYLFYQRDGAFLSKSTLKGSPAKNLPPESAAKPLPVVANCKDDYEKTSHKKECSTVTAVGKTSLSPVKNGGQPVNYGPYVGHPQPVVTANDNKMGPWSFHQPPGHQWLVPVMSPSEGLVYKPYPGPLPGAVYGGYGPFGPNPVTGNYANSAYGVPASHPHGTMGFPGASPAGHTYFPYGMPISNPAMSASAVEQVSQFTVPGSHSQTGPVAGAGANLNTEQQSSCTAPTQKEPISRAKMFQVSKGSDLQQRSTASSHCEITKGAGIGRNNEGSDPLLLFPLAPVALEGTQQLDVAEQPIRAIKVVPYNPRTATESAARIFRFIQEERKQFDSI